MHVRPVSSLKCFNSLLSVELVCVDMVGKMSLVQLAKRALVQLLLAFGRQYSIALGINRDSADKDVLSACRKVARKVHPDKGGSEEDTKRLNVAREKWEHAVRDQSAGVGSNMRSMSATASGKKGFRVQSVAVLLTYQGIAGLPHWQEFLTFVGASLSSWNVWRWCATLEQSKTGKYHVHLMVLYVPILITRS